MIKSKCCGSNIITYWGGGKPFCSICGRECDTIDPGRPAFHVDDKLKEAAKKASEVFEEEEKTDIERLEERVKKLEEALKLLVGILKVSPQSQHFSDVPSKVEDYFKTEMEYLLEDLKS